MAVSSERPCTQPVPILDHSIGILLGDGNGSFSGMRIIPLGRARPLALALGDVNGDAYEDIAVVSSGTNTINILLGTNHGAFTPAMVIATGFDTLLCSIVLADFNGDARLDIAVVDEIINVMSVLLGYGDGQFAERQVIDLGTGARAMAIAAGDFNNDTRPDIVVGNYETNAIGLCVLLGSSQRGFVARKSLFTGLGSQPWNLAVGDFNNGHFLDIATGHRERSEIAIFTGRGDGTFTNMTSYASSDFSSGHGMAVGHLNDDAFLDIVVANNHTNEIGIYMGFGDGRFADAQLFSTKYGSRPIAVAVGDFNKDNKSDIAVACFRSNTVEIFLKRC